MKILRAEILAFVNATEDFEKVISCIQNLFPKFDYTVQRTYGHFKNPIDVVEIKFGEKQVGEVIKVLKENLFAADKRIILSEIEERLDDKFYIRLDKMKACSGVAALGEGIQITLTVSSYPFNRKKIIEGLRQLFS